LLLNLNAEPFCHADVGEYTRCIHKDTHLP
jgi:hypothetical protein